MFFYLRIIAGPDKDKVMLLQEGAPLLLGRSRHAENRLNDLRISRVHCELEIEGDHAVVTDHESGGGTFVNGQRVAEQTVKAGDVIQIGDTQIRVDKDLKGESGAPAPAPAAAPAKLAIVSADRLQELAGKPLSHFQIESLLARGQSGLIFKARNFKDDKTVALKVLWPQAGQNNQEMRRFVRAIKTMLPLRHPNIVALHGAGKTGPYCWIAMDLVEGESLTQVIQRLGVAGRLDWRQALQVAAHLARALEFAHQNQVIHRNITPQNVLIRASDKMTLLGDLMLAKAMEGGLAEQITRPGELLGDLRFMSPERTLGTADVDHRSDIYSLGALLYALLTGRPPFEGNSLVETITKIRKAQPEKPKKFQMSIPDLFEGTVLTMLAKRPEERYESAAKLLTDLERVAKFQGVKL